MGKYRKDFVGWAKVAEEVENSARLDYVKIGAVFWCHFGVGIGTELVGKGKRFMRPAIVVAEIDETMVLVAPLTTKIQNGTHYTRVIVNGGEETAVLHQIRPVDKLRLGGFIEEISPEQLESVKRGYLKLLRKWLYRKI